MGKRSKIGFSLTVQTLPQNAHIHSLYRYYTQRIQYPLSVSMPLSVESDRLNFINVLQADYKRKDRKRVKKTDNLTVFLALLGSARVQAARKMLVKLTHGTPKAITD